MEHNGVGLCVPQHKLRMMHSVIVASCATAQQGGTVVGLLRLFATFWCRQV